MNARAYETTLIATRQMEKPPPAPMKERPVTLGSLAAKESARKKKH